MFINNANAFDMVENMQALYLTLLVFSVFVYGCSQQGSSTNVVSPSSVEQDTTNGADRSKPNIIVILADDMRAGYTGHEGHPVVKTPNIDSLAAKGVVFTNSFATSPVCTPSRTALLTGQYERKHGINFNSDSALSNQAYKQTYPMLLKEAGYFAAYIGKNHTPIGKNENGVVGYKSGVMDHSFDYWYSSHGHLGFYPKENPKHAIFVNAKSDTQVEIIEEGVENFFTPDDVFNAGYDFLKERPTDKPFAMLINFNVPHNGGTGSMEFRDSDLALYRTTYRDQIDSMQIPATYIAEVDIVEPKLPLNVYNGEYIANYGYVKTPQAMRERETRVVQTISGIDKLLGKLLRQLEQQSISDNTIIVFTSDHGILHGEFGLGGKSLLYEASVKVPLIIYDPRVEQPRKSDQLVALVDIAPTLLDLADLPVPDAMQGVSVKPLLQGNDSSWRQELFLENMMTIQNYPRIEAVRTKQWKYIRYFDKENDQEYADMLVASINGERPIYEELFNIESDPDEVRNVIAEQSNRETLKRLRQSVARMVSEYRGTEPLSTIKGSKQRVEDQLFESGIVPQSNAQN